MPYLLLTCLLFLSACSSRYASNAENEYLQSQHAPLLQVPAPLVKHDFSQYYVLPAPRHNAKVSILPPLDPIQEPHANKRKATHH